MRRDDLYITVPSFFRCPISLDLMKSPVSLCTGVTYDRASIQRWLDGGNNTCPATMQVLQSKEFIPNRTLQRLIELWSESVRRRATVESPESAAPTRDEVAIAIERVKFEKEVRDDLEMLSKILRFARESEENREFLAGKEDFVPMLVDLMGQVDSRTFSIPKLQVIQEAVMILSVVRSKISDRKRFSNLILSNGRDCLTAFVVLLKSRNSHMKIDCAAVLEFIAVDAESKLLIAERDGLIHELIKSINRDNDQSLIEASLSCLIAIASPKRVKLTLVRENLVTELTKLLTDPATASASVIEKCLKLLETLASCKEGRAEICGGVDAAEKETACVVAVVKKLMKVSAAATEHAVTVLWSVCYLFKEEKAQEAVMRTNGVTKILLLLQSNCSPAVRHMLTDLLKVFKVNSRSCLSAYDTKTTHIMPF
ncbi:PREDICTED: U-box domain-containing protein 27 [Tarenaya hassleriana]|uniref:U-box domain-containing protein 27 n=1 Tax=Tarenaya hassleriana TaxID=28532 RepID=UPI00053C47D1|nr:PREDICTED: U-box domain-containing protein 27 [Tarenaya hassleriana]